MWENAEGRLFIKDGPMPETLEQQRERLALNELRKIHGNRRPECDDPAVGGIAFRSDSSNSAGLGFNRGDSRTKSGLTSVNQTDLTSVDPEREQKIVSWQEGEIIEYDPNFSEGAERLKRELRETFRTCKENAKERIAVVHHTAMAAETQPLEKAGAREELRTRAFEDEEALTRRQVLFVNESVKRSSRETETQVDMDEWHLPDTLHMPSTSSTTPVAVGEDKLDVDEGKGRKHTGCLQSQLSPAACQAATEAIEHQIAADDQMK